MNYDLCCILWPFFLNDANVKWKYHLFLVHLHSRATISFRFDIWVKVTLALGLLFGGVLLFEDFCTSFCVCIHFLSVTLIALFFAYRQFSLLYVLFMSAIFPFSTFISPALFHLTFCCFSTLYIVDAIIATFIKERGKYVCQKHQKQTDFSILCTLTAENITECSIEYMVVLWICLLLNMWNILRWNEGQHMSQC